MILGGAAPAEETAELIGIVLMFVIVALAVALFMYSGSLTSRFRFLDKEISETKYGVTGFAEKSKEAFAPHRSKRLIIGVMLCICSVIPVLAFEVLFGEENDFACILGVCLMFLMAAIAVYNFVWTEINWASYQKLLQEANYAPEKKRMKSENAGIIVAYWAFVFAIYLGISLYTIKWGTTWIIVVVAAISFPAFLYFYDKHYKHIR